MPSQDPTSWGDVAEWYDRLLGGEDTFQKNVVLPHLTRLMALKPGDRVLDLACGPGFFASAFVETGAIATGADISPELIDIAKKHAGNAGASFVVAPSDKTPFDAASFDHATIVLAIQNIDDAKGTFAECARVLRPGGALHLVLNHPAFRIPKRSSWEWDKSNRQYRRIDGYMSESKEKIVMHPGKDAETSTLSFHRPMQFYVKMLAKSGFVVADLEEWLSHKTSDSGPRAPEENRARKEIPMFLYMKATRV